MQFKAKDINSYTLSELQSIDWELGSQEYKFNEALKHKKFEKLKPLPEISPSFAALREEVKNEIERKSKNG